MELKRRNFICMGIAACICLTSCGVLPTEEEFDAAPVVKEYEGTSFNKVTVVRGNLVQTEDISGTYKGTVREDFEVDGVSVIKKIFVKKGMKVKAGDVIFQYLLPGSETALRKAENEIEKTSLQIRHARKIMDMELKKQRRLGGSSKEMENIRNQYAQQIRSYESSLKLLQMDAKIAREEIDNEKVTATENGVVTYVDSAAEGSYGDIDKAIVKIEGASKNRFEASSEYASQCKDGDVVTIDGLAQEYKATVRKEKDSKDTIYFYPNAKLNLEDGTKCTYKVVLKEKKDVLYLPASIVYTMGERHVVYFEDENGLKSIKEVTVGERINNFIEITGGLSEGEQVVAN